MVWFGVVKCSFFVVVCTWQSDVRLLKKKKKPNFLQLTAEVCVTFLCFGSWSQFTAVLPTILWRRVGTCPCFCL